ncbi:MAG: HsdM family class I SAM-dependent methyltransferase, partial [Chitinophagales bacterium]
NNKLIQSLLLSETEEVYATIKNHCEYFSFEDMIEAFELAIPSKEQKINGAVYTPEIIKDFIVEKGLKKLQKPINEIIAGDIACGCGAFLFTLANLIHDKTEKSYREIYKEQLFGLDISESSIERAKILLSLLAIENGEDEIDFDFNLFTANALAFDWKQVTKIEENKGFDLIVGNPPYVRTKNMDVETKKLLKKWQVTKSGNPDLYIPFFEIGIKNLNEKGVLGYITVNSFYRSVNARSLRTYWQFKNLGAEIIDFGDEKIFGRKSAYTCICFLSKNKSETLSFTKSNLNTLKSIEKKDFTPIAYKSLNAHRGWLLNNSKAIDNIQKIEAKGASLGSLYTIKNGIATLSNDVYIFKPLEETDQYYRFEKDGKTYQIEKGICRDIIKPNILKTESEIPSIKEKLIYPYTNGVSPYAVMKEDALQSNFPSTYQYLSNYRERLDKRDKGKGDYGAWYAFGRTQALNDKGLKLLFPYMAKQPYFVYTNQKDLLIYCGYAIFADTERELLVLKRLLESKVFDYYMKNTSKPYSGGYVSYAKNYVKNFGVCELEEEEKEFLLNTQSQKETDIFWIDKYELTF